MNVLRKICNDQSGSIAVTMALAMIPILLAAGGAIEYNKVLNSKTAVQAKLDVVVLAGAYGFLDNADLSPDKQKEKVEAILTLFAENWETDDHFSTSSKPSFEINSKDKTVKATVKLIVSSPLLGLVGINSIVSEVKSSAGADVESQPVCILALDGTALTGIEFTGDGELKAKDCVVWSNSRGHQSLKFNGKGKIKSELLCTVGRAGFAGQYSVEPEAEEECVAVTDPLKFWKPPTYGACTSTDAAWMGKVSVNLEPGVYCGGLRVNAKNIKLSPGLYVIKDGPLILHGSSKITGKNIGILLSGNNTYLEVDGKAKVDISSAETGDMAGIVFASDSTVTQGQSTISGRSDLKIGGVIYLPHQKITYWGESNTTASSPVTTIIAGTIKIGGDAFLEVTNNKKKAKYAPVISTGGGTVKLLY